MKQIPNLKSIKDIPKIEKMGVVIEFDPQEEDINIFEQLEDEETAQKVADRYNSGDRAAWFCAHVIVRYRGFDADDYLGACSYGSFKEFTTTDKDYYMSMVNKCIDQINKDVEFANKETCKFWNIRKAKNILAPYGLHVVSSLSIHPL
jgi:hypothetical protein